MSGTLDAVKLMQGGYPTRIPYVSIHGRYRDMMPDNIKDLPPAEFCEVIAEVVGIGRADYSLGIERMFFKMGAAAFLEELQVRPAHSARQPSATHTAQRHRCGRRPRHDHTTGPFGRYPRPCAEPLAARAAGCRPGGDEADPAGEAAHLRAEAQVEADHREGPRDVAQHAQ
eukprot:1942492-Prymnesium_polylepis.1